MNPVAFTIFGIDVMWYGVLISAGVLLGVLIALKEAKRT
ncbi:MAG TPA: prolipoprotein diacylglyceryl transferase, partial [Sedimentibacter sp.]|nr:prolipoprotein diacylglyceryl transferase [Sedimentibacter sp.]